MARKKVVKTEEMAITPDEARASEPAPPAPAAEGPVDISPEPACKDCIFWKRVSKEHGECRYNPPAILDLQNITPHGPRVKFGLTVETLSCGKFQAA
jgi:hypothetical protein